MKNQIKTVKSRAILFLAIFALVIAVFALAFSFNLIYSFQKRIAVQSAEFNLQLVANLVEQDLRDLTALTRWYASSKLIAGYFLADDGLTSRSMEAWHALNDQYINNRAGRYVRRLIVLYSRMQKFLQVGNMAITSIPVTVYNLEKIFAAGVERNGLWQAAIFDPYMFGDVPVIPLMYPVYDPDTGDETGTVFLAVSAGLITDKLNGYQAPGDSHLYLELGNRRYAIEGGQIVPEKTAEKDGAPMVRCSVRDGIILSQSLSPALPFSGAWPALAAGLGILIILILIMAWGVNRMAREISGLMERQLGDEKNKRDLEYRMLQSQINPHFLYNTLNSIKWMATIQNATGIAEMTTALSRFLKTLSKDIRKTVPLGDELALLKDYLVIQKYRYGGSVSFENRIGDQTLLDTPIPRFTLQPLAENAIFHGIEPKGNGVIVLDAERRDGDVLVSLTDNGAGMNAETLAGIGVFSGGEGGTSESEAPSGSASSDLRNKSVGIRNVDERLRYAFGEAYGLSIQSEAGAYTSVTIRLPGSPALLSGAA
jgi:two-component system sensor histidine kinase YesM